MPRRQRTVRDEGEIRGIGLHSGADVTLRVRPAKANHGVVFIRTDIEGNPRIRALASSLRERERRTALVGERDAEIHTVEHFLSSCHALRLDNLEVHVSGPECPGLDGSAAGYFELLSGLGVEEQDADRREIRVRHPVVVQSGPSVSVIAFPGRGNGLTVSYTLDYDHQWLGTQHFSTEVSADRFRDDVAPARTFCLASEAEALRAANLGRGANYDNTLVVGDEGVIQNELRWPNEFARHKTLDLLGDLCLLGADLVAHVTAYRSGHAANLKLVQALEHHALTDTEEDLREAEREPALRQGQIRRILPHRYPFLLVDRVIELDGYTRAVGIKNVSINEPFFQGHYPEEPIMPGVLILEAMAQLAGILLLRKLELTGKIPVLLSVDRVKFRKAVVPGDQIRLEAFTLRLSSGRGRIRARATVDGGLVAESRLNFALTEPPDA